MIVLAIDPGTTESAYIIMNLSTLEIIRFGKEENNHVLWEIDRCKRSLCDKLIVEMIASQGMSVGQTTFDTCVWVGRFIERWNSDCDVIYRREEKQALCLNQKAKDSNIRQSLIDMFGGESVAIGNKKCPICKAKRWVGRDHAVCKACNGAGWIFPPGPLSGISKDVWAALAVAVTYGIKCGILIVSGITLVSLGKSFQHSDHDT